MAFSACSSAPPKGVVCIADVKNVGFQCHDEPKQKDYFLPFDQSDNDILLRENYWIDFLDYCKRK